MKQFAGEWLTLPADQQTTLPRLGHDGTWNRLGIDAAIGDRSWDVQARIVLCIGPLLRAEFEALLPDQPAFRRLVSLVQAFLGLETRFAINPVLAREAASPLRLTDAANPRLGWNTWINEAEGQRRAGATDACFDVA